VKAEATVAEAGERALLRRFRERIPAGPGVVVGIGDDAAAVETTPLTLVTTDSLVEGVHFRREWSPPHLLGRKALAVNLSDVAAMGGRARYATVSLALPADLTLGFLDGIYDGLLERASGSGVAIVGGNVAATGGPMVVDVTLLGDAGRSVLRRAGARAGDLVAVTGTLGGAAAGLRLLRDSVRLRAGGGLDWSGPWAHLRADDVERAVRAHLDPAPPVALGAALGGAGLVHAAIDLSDGLSGDLLHVCEESGVTAEVDAEALPIDPAAARIGEDGGLALALDGGEDYQLLLAVPEAGLPALRALAAASKAAVTVIGAFAEGGRGVSLRANGAVRPLRPASHEHFRR
jgi:thiamine-monophosphate kinase